MAPVCGGATTFQSADNSRVQNTNGASFTDLWRSQNKFPPGIKFFEAPWPRRGEERVGMVTTGMKMACKFL
jgi:hypothetical protein